MHDFQSNLKHHTKAFKISRQAFKNATYVESAKICTYAYV